CAEDAAFLLWASRASKRASENNIGVRGVNDNSAYAASFLQAHIRPGLPGVGGFINSVADHIAIADNPSLSGSRPDYACVSWRYGKCANSRGRLLVENWCPSIAAVGRFPYATGSCSSIVGARISRHTSHGCNAVPNARTNEAKSKLAIFL